MLLVEVEGTHTLQNTYDSLDIHLGQSYSVLVRADQPPQGYYIVISTRFTSQVLSATSVLHYSNSAGSVSGPPPGGPTTQIDWSLEQARSLRYLQNPVSFSLYHCMYLVLPKFLPQLGYLDTRLAELSHCVLSIRVQPNYKKLLLYSLLKFENF